MLKEFLSELKLYIPHSCMEQFLVKLNISLKLAGKVDERYILCSQGHFLLYPFDYVLFFSMSSYNLLNDKDGKLLRKELYLYPSLSHFKFMFKNFDQKILKDEDKSRELLE